MAKPWADIVKQQSGNGYAEDVTSDVGEHLRTRPSEGVTPPGGGRPTGNTADNAPVSYGQGMHDDVLGTGDNEELYAPPPAVRPEDGKAPVQPQEFEATWQERYLQRTQTKSSTPAYDAHVGRQLILPVTFNAASTADNDIEGMRSQMVVMQAAIDKAIIAKQEEDAKAPNDTFYVSVTVTKGVPTATLTSAGIEAPIAVSTALALIQALIK